MDRYRFNLRSQELKGATQLNGLYLGLDSDAAAGAFAANLETVFSARVISSDKVTSRDYTDTPPAATGLTYRVHLRDAAGTLETSWINNVVSEAAFDTLKTEILAAQVIESTGEPVTSVIGFPFYISQGM